MTRLNITNGGSAVELMQVCKIAGDKISWDDVLHEGPLPADKNLAEMSNLRAEFIAQQGWATLEQAQHKFQQRDARLGEAAIDDQVVLWFEHDLYDQLQLIQILDWLNHQSDKPVLSLINPDKYLGYHSPEEFAALESTATRVTEAQLSLASNAWQAVCSADPELINRFLLVDSGPLPFLKEAILRLAQEYPFKNSGLPLTEKLILDSINSGLDKPVEIFRDYQSREAAKFMGDSIFWNHLNKMTQGKFPLLKFSIPEPLTYPLNPDQRIQLLPMAQSAMTGEMDWFLASQQHKYVGGCLVSPSNAWRWSPEHGKLLKENI